jgi:hypothetical protein
MVEIKVDDNLLEKIGRQQGLRNRADILDLTTWEQVNREMTKEINNAPVNITVQLDPKINKQRVMEVTELTTDMATSCSWLYRENFLLLYDEYRHLHRPFDRFASFLKNYGFALPQIRILNGTMAKQELKKCGFPDYTIERENLLVNFQLPKPLAHYWDHVSNDPPSGIRVAEKAVKPIPWGDFYECLTGIPWKEIDDFEQRTGLEVCRINPVGCHDPDLYYYLWEIGDKISALSDYNPSLAPQDWEEQNRDDDAA